jgi:hypothetical protein
MRSDGVNPKLVTYNMLIFGLNVRRDGREGLIVEMYKSMAVAVR